MKVLAAFCLVFVANNSIPLGDQKEEAQKLDGKIWGVLVAGSNEWYNYRHQADVYHAYQVVRNHGIPDSNVIVFHFDDIAHNSENPTPGQVINKPGGRDVYHGVPKDYTGDEVTPKNFLAAIQGDEELAAAGKKVVKSGPKDHVFIFFADHGATDLIAFPTEYLYGEDLNKALENMYKNKRYAKLVFYLEACESGSMFNTLLPKNINIYATTASNPTESSYACYYDEKRGTYLGDVYSVNWIENSDVKSFGKETLIKQFEIVQKETNTSHVQEYGDLTIGKLPLTQFQGEKSSLNQLIGGEEFVAELNPVDSGDVPIAIALKKIASAKNEEQRHKLLLEYEQLMRGRNYLINHLTRFVESIKHLVGNEVNYILNAKQEVFHRSCYRQFVDTFHRQCLNLNQHSYALRKLHVFVNVCEMLHRNNDIESVPNAVKALENYCEESYVSGYPESIK
jgi:legumain